MDDLSEIPVGERLEVLNISNVNAEEKIVLNDERLLELIQQYPFLYNPRVRPFQDPDYDDWSWERITESFNQSYVMMTRPAFSSEELQNRWQILKPIIKSLSKAYDINAIPESLRQIVIKISVQLDDQTTDSKPKPVSSAQRIILDNIPMVNRLSMVRRRELEAEIMELILTSELETKSTIKVGGAEMQLIEEKYEDFINILRLKELHVMDKNKTNAANVKVAPTSADLDSENMHIVSVIFPPAEEMILPDEIHVSAINTAEDEKVPNTLLKETVRRRWVPLKEARFHVRSCVVRIKRTSLKDYVPLAQIKREKLW